MEDEDDFLFAKRCLENIRVNLGAFEESMLNCLTAGTEPLTPKVAFNLLAYREALAWRVVELTGGAIVLLDREKFIPAIVTVRSLVESVAANHYLLYLVRKCIAEDSASGLDEKAMNLLLGTRWQDWEFQSTNVLGMIDRVDKSVRGFRSLYDNLCEYTHPNYPGVLQSFSKRKDMLEIELGRYPNRAGQLFKTSTDALMGSLMLFEKDYNATADLFPKIIDLCDREFENPNRDSNN